MADDPQLDRIEEMLKDRLGSIDERLRELNGAVARNTQTLDGRGGRGGLVDEVRDFKAWARGQLDQMERDIGDVSKAATGQGVAANTSRETWTMAIRVSMLVLAALGAVGTVWRLVA